MFGSKGVFQVPVGRDVLFASAASNLLALALPLVLLQVYDRIIPNQGYETLIVLSIGLIVAIVLDVALKNARGGLMAWAGARFEAQISERAINKLLTGDLSAIERDSAGAHLDRLNSIDKIRDFRTGDAATAFLDIPFAAIFLLLVAYISLPIAIIVCVIAGVAVFFMRRIEESTRKVIEQRSEIDTRRHSFLIEVLRSIETVKSLGIGDFMERRYERLLSTAAKLGAKSSEMSHLSQGIAGSVTQVTTAVVASVGAVMVINGHLTVGALAASILLSGRVMQPLFRVESINNKSEELKIWEGRLVDFFEEGDERSGGIDPGEIHSIRLDDVSFRHTADGPLVLKNVNLEVRRGEIIAIAGASGSGKSSLMLLMTGELTPTSGQIYINEHRIEDCDPRVLRRQISALPQRHSLLDGTIIENMTRFDPARYAVDALRIASELELESFFAAHPEGLSYQVRSGHVSDIPASVVDRVALVRGLVNLPRMILFDESNQSLDREADIALLNYLQSQRNRAGMVFVTQRPSYAALANQRYLLMDGELFVDKPERNPAPVKSAPPQASQPLGQAG